MASCEKENGPSTKSDSETGTDTTSNNEGTEVAEFPCADDISWNDQITYGTVTDIENNTYKTIVIGSQEWMAENLKTRSFNNGDSVSLANEVDSWVALNNQSKPACSWYTEERDSMNIDYSSCYGLSYNGFVIDDTREICPVGWHVPNYDDVLELEYYIIDSLGFAVYSAIPLKSSEGWITYDGGDGNGEDLLGFRGHPFRLRGQFGAYDENLNDYLAYYWTSTDSLSFGTLYYHFWGFGANNTNIIGPNTFANARNGYGIRCIRD